MKIMQRVVARFEAGQYWLHEKGRFDDFMQLDFAQGNGLIVQAGSFVAVLCGTEFGAAFVDLNWLNEDPGPPDLDRWDEVVEISIKFSQDDGILNASLGVRPPATPLASGSYRLRVHARGRDEGNLLEHVIDQMP